MRDNGTKSDADIMRDFEENMARSRWRDKWHWRIGDAERRIMPDGSEYVGVLVCVVLDPERRLEGGALREFAPIMDGRIDEAEIQSIARARFIIARSQSFGPGSEKGAYVFFAAMVVPVLCLWLADIFLK